MGKNLTLCGFNSLECGLLVIVAGIACSSTLAWQPWSLGATGHGFKFWTWSGMGGRGSDLSLWFCQEGSLSPCLSTVPFQVTVEGCCTYFQYAPSIQPAAPQTRPHWEKLGRGTLSERQQQRSPLRQGLGPLPLFLQFAMTGLALALPLIHCFHSAAPFSVPRVLDP